MFGGPWGHAQNGGLGASGLSRAEDSLFTVSRQLEDGSCWEAAFRLEQRGKGRSLEPVTVKVQR